MAYVTFWRAGACLALGSALAGSVAVFGCSGGSAAGAASPTAADGKRPTAIEHETCDESGHKVELLDATGDGKPDIRKVFDGAREICRITDLNQDGHADLYEYFEKDGQLRRREFDFDDNNVVNQIDFYENGKLARRELDTKNQGKIDTWDTYDPATAKLVKRERDSTGDGRVDQWWTYEAGNVTIAMDRNGDGKPDPESTMVLGPDGRPIVEAGAPPASAASAEPPPPPPPPAPAGPDSPLVISDAGTPGKPARGGAKR